MARMGSSNSRYYFPALANVYAGLHDWAYVLLRVAVALVLMAHGAQKLFGMFGGPGMNGFIGTLQKVGYPMSGLFGWMIALLEFGGGFLLLIGLFTRPVAFAVLIFMLEAARFHMGVGGFFWTVRGNEYPLILAALSVYFIAHGGGPYSVDSKMSKEF